MTISKPHPVNHGIHQRCSYRDCCKRRASRNTTWREWRFAKSLPGEFGWGVGGPKFWWKLPTLAIPYLGFAWDAWEIFEKKVFQMVVNDGDLITMVRKTVQNHLKQIHVTKLEVSFWKLKSRLEWGEVEGKYLLATWFWNSRSEAMFGRIPLLFARWNGVGVAEIARTCWDNPDSVISFRIGLLHVKEFTVESTNVRETEIICHPPSQSSETLDRFRVYIVHIDTYELHIDGGI